MAKEIKVSIREMIAATGSERRRRMMADLMKWIEEHDYSDYEIVVHNLSPDRDAGIEESDSAESTVVAWEKTLVVALSLGLLEESDIPVELMKEWENVIRIIGPMKSAVGDEKAKTTIFGGDVVTKVRTTNSDDQGRELLKIERDLVGKTPEEQREILDNDLLEIKKLYCDPDGFVVIYDIGIALLSKDELGDKRGVVAGWEVKLKFKPLPEEIVEKAYEISPAGEKLGSAFQVGPRVDLASLASAQDEHGNYLYLDQDYGVWVRNVNSEDELFKPIQVEVMRGLVVGGLLPPHLCLELLMNLDEQEPIVDKPVVPVQIKMEIGAEAMLEAFTPILDNVQIETVGDTRVIHFPDKVDSTKMTDISLDDEGKLTSIGELILRLAVLRLVEDDKIMADAAMKYLQTRLGI